MVGFVTIAIAWAYRNGRPAVTGPIPRRFARGQRNREELAEAFEVTLAEAVPREERGRAAVHALEMVERLEHVLRLAVERDGPASPIGEPAVGAIGREALDGQRVVPATTSAGTPTADRSRATVTPVRSTPAAQPMTAGRPSGSRSARTIPASAVERVSNMWRYVAAIPSGTAWSGMSGRFR